jgi:hypothetical protein
MSRVRILLSAALAILASASLSHAGTVLGSGPLKMAANDNYACTAVNVGSASLAQVTVDVTIVGSNVGSGATETCSALAANGACEATNQAGGATYRFCTVSVVGSRKNVRASFCNLTSGVCLPIQ